MPVAVTTRGYDNARSGANTQETALTATAVATRGIRRLYSLQMMGDRRGAEGQPLIVPNVAFPDGTTREVVYVASMSNGVYAFDAADGTLLWERTLGRPINGGRNLDAYLINDHWGVLSTPVIDPDAGVMYVVAWVSVDGSVAKARHQIHAVSLVDGSAVHPFIDLENASYDPGHGLPKQQFKSAVRKQRCSLLLTSVGGVKTVFVASGSVQETSHTSRGFVIAVGTDPFAVTAVWTATSKGWGAGIWQAGAGLAADAQGFIYGMTGNGTFDAVTDFSESFIKLRYTPPAGATAASIEIVDWWTPFTDAARVHPEPPPQPAPVGGPTNQDVNEAEWGDQDLGSGGPVLIPGRGFVAGAGKDAILFVLDPANMGKSSLTDLNNAAANYAKLKAPPIWFNFYTPANPAPADIRDLNQYFGNATHHQHGSPIAWNSPDHGPMLFCWGENGNLRAWSVGADGTVAYLATGIEQASVQTPIPLGGMPGGMMTLSANGNQAHTGVLWACIPYGDANKQVTAGRLLAYDATQFDTFPDGSRKLRVIWDSQQWGVAFSFNKFNLPVVANGRLYVPTYDGRVDVYG